MNYWHYIFFLRKSTSNEVSLTQVCKIITSPNITTTSNHSPVITDIRVGRQKRNRRHTRQITTNTDNTKTSRQRIELLRSICQGVSNIGVNILHDCVISLEEQLVLSVGLNFIPPPRKRLNNILSEGLDKFKRRVRIKKHFAAQPD